MNCGPSANYALRGGMSAVGVICGVLLVGVGVGVIEVALIVRPTVTVEELPMEGMMVTAAE